MNGRERKDAEKGKRTEGLTYTRLQYSAVLQRCLPLCVCVWWEGGDGWMWYRSRWLIHHSTHSLDVAQTVTGSK